MKGFERSLESNPTEEACEVTDISLKVVYKIEKSEKGEGYDVWERWYNNGYLWEGTKAFSSDEYLECYAFIEKADRFIKDYMKARAEGAIKGGIFECM